MRKELSLLSAFLLIAGGCAKESGSGNITPAEVPQTEVTVEETPTYINVLLDDGLTSLVEDQLVSGILKTKSDALNSVTAELGVESMERLFPFAGEFEPRTRKEGLHRWYRVRLSGDTPVTKAMNSFQGIPGVEFVEEPLPIRPGTNDPYWASDLWGLNNVQYPAYDVNCDSVWTFFTTGDPKVIVAVLDGGIQLDHPDLAWNCLESGHQSYVTGETDIAAHGHGTHVAGTIAAVSNNRLGVAGIAGGDYALGRKGVSLLSMQCFYDYTGSDGKTRTRSGSFETAMKEAADKGAVISQNSWGYNADTDDDGKISSEELQRIQSVFNNIQNYAIAAAIDYFVKYAGCDNDGNQLPDSPMKGGLVVFAAGNDNIPYGPPANYEPVVAVGAMNVSGTKASYSNYGDWVDICAPGSYINSTYPTSTYARLSGTSMACPHVSGVAALITSYFGGQGFTADDLKKRLLEGAREIGPSTGDTPIGPMVNAYGSFMVGETAVPPVVEDFTLTPVGHNVRLNFKGNDAYGYLVLAAPSRKTILEANLTNPSGSRLVTGNIVVPIPEDRDKPQEFILSGLDQDTDYYIAIAAYSYNRRYSDLSALKTVHTNVNAAPTVTTSYTGRYRFRNYEDVDIAYVIADSDEDPLTVDFQTDGRATFTLEDDGAWHFRLSCQLVRAPAAFSASLVVTDGFGGRYSEKFSYSVLENVAPVLTGEIPGILLGKEGESRVIDLDEWFSDEDGETLTYRVSSYDGSAVKAEITDRHILTITSVSSALSSSEIRVSAYDTIGASARADIPCIVRPEGENVSLLEGRVVNSVLTILTGEMPERITVRLVSASGATVFQTKGEYSAFNPVVIDLKGLSPGVYTLIVIDGSGNETRYPVIKR